MAIMKSVTTYMIKESPYVVLNVSKIYLISLLNQ